MNSIKNAIVTVTLLAVGYGSFIVLSEPEPNRSQVAAPFAVPAGEPSGEVFSNEELPSLEIDQALHEPASHSGQTPSPPENRFPPSTLPEFGSTPTVQPVATNPKPNPFGALPEIPALENDITANSSTASPDFPALPPLPDLIVTPPNPGLEMPLGTRQEVPSTAQPTELVPNPGLAVEPPPQLEVNQPTALPELEFNRTAEALPSTTTLPTTNQTVEAAIQPAVAGPNVVAAPSLASPKPLDKTPAHLAAPNEIDVQPVSTESVAAILPPIDPSVGPIPPAPNEGSVAFEKVWSEVQSLVRSKDPATALRTLSPWSADSNLNQEQGERCFRMLDELAGTVIYSRTSILEPAYTVRAGETLEEICAAYRVPQDLLAKINGIRPPYALSTGETVKVVRGPFRAEVSLSNKRLTLYAGPYYAGRFSIEIGRDLPPEEAFYEVGEKSLGRNYFDRRSGSEVLRGQEDNRYGDHWLGLRGEHITTGHSVGIHGRSKKANPQDIGCISLDAIDAGDVFSILSIGSRIQVRR